MRVRDAGLLDGGGSPLAQWLSKEYLHSPNRVIHVHGARRARLAKGGKKMHESVCSRL